jgi:hypothetical protein
MIIRTTVGGRLPDTMTSAWTIELASSNCKIQTEDRLDQASCPVLLPSEVNLMPSHEGVR